MVPGYPCPVAGQLPGLAGYSVKRYAVIYVIGHPGDQAHVSNVCAETFRKNAERRIRWLAKMKYDIGKCFET